MVMELVHMIYFNIKFLIQLIHLIILQLENLLIVIKLMKGWIIDNFKRKKIISIINSQKNIFLLHIKLVFD